MGKKKASKAGTAPRKGPKAARTKARTENGGRPAAEGDAELDLKALAAASGNRKMQLVPVKELQGLTGYIRGGVTALAAKKDYPVYADEGIKRFDVISISAGVRGLQILLAPADYVAVTRAVIVALAKPERTQ